MNDKFNPEDHAELQRTYAPLADPRDVELRKKEEIANKRRQAEEKMRSYVTHSKTIEGVVKHVNYNHNEEMNFGFVTPDDTLLDDLFVHHSEIEPWREGFKEVRKGDRVSFKIAPGKGGKYQAVTVEVLRRKGGVGR